MKVCLGRLSPSFLQKEMRCRSQTSNESAWDACLPVFCRRRWDVAVKPLMKVCLSHLSPSFLQKEMRCRGPTLAQYLPRVLTLLKNRYIFSKTLWKILDLESPCYTKSTYFIISGSNWSCEAIHFMNKSFNCFEVLYFMGKNWYRQKVSVTFTQHFFIYR
jgi:hypothetical protein